MKRLFFKHFWCVLFFVCLVFTLALCAETGTAGIGFTKDTAIKNALKHGVEKKIREYVPDHVYRQNEQLITREFIDSAFLYVLDTNVVFLNTQFNCFKVEARINIDNIRLKEKLEERGLEVKKTAKPAIVLLVDEYQDGNIMPEKTAGIVLKQILVKNGYTVLDLDQAEINNRSGDTVHLASTAEFGFENSADLVIKGTVNTGKASGVDVYGKEQKTVPVQMNVEAIRTDNAQIIFSSTISLRKNASNEFSALQFALKSAAQKMGEKIVVELDVFCENDDYAVRHFEFIVNGVNYAKAGEFESSIKKISCVKSVKLCYLEEQRASYSISINGSIAELTKEISQGKIPDLEIESLTNSKIVAVYKNELHGEAVYKKLSDEVDITSFFIEDLYLSRIGHYALNPVGHFTLKCSVPVFDVRANLTIPEILDDTFRVRREHIDVGESKFDISIIPVIPKNGNISQTQILQGQLELCYTINEKVYTRSLSVPVMVYGINGMNWNTPDAISCFVTSEEPCVRSFSRMAMQNLTSDSEYGTNFVNAMAVHAAIKQYKIQYTKDPAPILGTVDMVQYPSQTLSYKTGDCDDISVLYCSVLLSLGIDVALLSYDDHVFFMFNTGIYEKNRMMLSPDTTMTIIHNKKVWIPIESTDMQSSFADNWRNTSRKFYKMVSAGMNVEIIDIKKAWKTYPPHTFFTKEQNFSIKPVTDEVKAELQKVRDTRASLYTKEIERLKSIKKGSVSKAASIKNRIGLLYVHSGDYQKAASFFKKAYQIDKSPLVLSNHAGALLLCGKEKEAKKIFDKIYKEDAGGKIAVNRTLCSYVSLNESVKGEGFYSCILEALSVVNSDVKLSEILGLDITSPDSARASNSTQSGSESIDIGILRQHIRAVLDSLRDYRVSGITTESSSGTKISGITTESSSGTKISGITTESSSGMNIAGTTTETSTGSTTTSNNYKPQKFGGLRGVQAGDLQKLVYLLYWFDF